MFLNVFFISFCFFKIKKFFAGESQMKQNFFLFLILLVLTALTACRNLSNNGYQSSGSSSASTPTTLNEGLTNSKVEVAVADLLSDWRLGGSVSVRGIQELPQQNSAVGDLQFNNFQYGTTYEGWLIKGKDFKPKSLPNDQSRLPSMGEMFPQRKVVYSKDGKALLSRYNDGRWVLKEVRWGFDTGVKGIIEIR